jgi:transcriptional regulator with GAF, ATPase, and Fis domain
MIIEDGRLLGIITRLKLFERLGHRFGVELFLQKPIIQLKDLIRTHAQAMPGYSRIDEAIQYALSRPAPDIYDPIVVQRSNGTMKLLDINSLLLAQSRAMASLSNVVGNLEQIDKLITAGRDKVEIFNKILQLLRQIVPYHQAGILVSDGTEMSFVAHYGYRLAPNRADGVLKSATYALIVTHRQAIYIPNAHKVPGWTGLESLGKPHAWLGVPLLDNGKSLGLLSISRNVERAFSPEERETALAFAQRITALIGREQQDSSLVNQWSESLGTNFQSANGSVSGRVFSKPFLLKAALVAS